MKMKEEITKEGIKITHPSGVVTITTIENLRKIKEHAQKIISELQQQIESINEKIKAIEKLSA